MGARVLFEVLTLFSLGFVVGLSGAVIPGPLLAFTVFDTLRKGRVTGHAVIFGHVLWELAVILMILLGFGGVVTENRLLIYIFGGLVLVVMGAAMMRSRGGNVGMESSRVGSSLAGGVFYTAFNPTQPLWWVTAGLALLQKGVEVMGIAGIVTVTSGHWVSDFIYYVSVSLIVHRHGRYINPRLRQMSILLGSFIVLLGAYLLTQGVQQLLL